jgi:hypothetical protein
MIFPFWENSEVVTRERTEKVEEIFGGSYSVVTIGEIYNILRRNL